MTVEEKRKQNARGRMRLYRERHRDDPVYKARIAEEKRRQLARQSEQQKERRKERSREGTRRYRAKNPRSEADKEKARDLTRQWREQNPERWRENNKAWAAANRDKILAYMRAYFKDHPDQRPPEIIRANAALRRSRKRQAMPPWADKDEIAQVYKAARQRQIETAEMWHVDHIIPLKHDLVCGLHVVANLQIIPGSENLSKNNRFVVA